jgi:hypothetical protein
MCHSEGRFFRPEESAFCPPLLKSRSLAPLGMTARKLIHYRKNDWGRRRGDPYQKRKGRPREAGGPFRLRRLTAVQLEQDLHTKLHAARSARPNDRVGGGNVRSGSDSVKPAA